VIRAPSGDLGYWEGRVRKLTEALAHAKSSVGTPSANPSYEPQYWIDQVTYSIQLLLFRYSRGDPIRDLGQHFAGLLDAWELSNRLAAEICTTRNLKSCRDWTFALSDLNHYNWCFWLIALGLLLDIPEEQWRRLTALVDGEGEDVLLDRVIATRDTQRKVGSKLLHRKPYARLLAAIDGPKAEQAMLLKEFVDHWYAELARKGKDELWWYIYGDPVKHPLEMGSYFGRWCLEAAVVAKAFAIDDTLCLGHEHYPGDFLRPDGPSTHPASIEAKSGLLGRLFGRR
jgi:hypothetical protein